ncbi:NAD(P)-binding protein [Candidatus Zixiibacteriota bacterium]
MAEQAPAGNSLSAAILVVGGGMAGMTAAIEASEVSKEIILLEKGPSLGGAVSRMNQYFPKLCPPNCGVEINYKRLRTNKNVRVLTLAEVESISGSPGNYQVQIRVNPRFVNEKCTACGECAKVCEIERDNEHNWGMDKTKAVYLPHQMAYPMRYVVDPAFAADPKMKVCADACEYGAVELDQQPQAVTANVGAIVWATGWVPYDATKIENLGFGKVPNVITNVMMERLAASDGPTGGKIQRPSDNAEISSVAFVQCAGSRDDNHLPYCSAVCCMASMKQATYIREQYPEAEINVFYIDIRSPGRLEDFYMKMQQDEKMHFLRGKVAKVTAGVNGDVTLEAEDTLTGKIQTATVNMAVLATGMVPATAAAKPPIDVETDEYGFLVQRDGASIIGAGTTVRPLEVSATVQDGTGAALKGIISAGGR